MTTHLREKLAAATRPIIGIQNRTAQEVFDMMSDRFTGLGNALLDEVEGLRAALRPFAKMADHLDNTDARRDAIYCGGSPGLLAEVKNSDYHAARKKGLPDDQ
jgi:hypothetical protein